MFLNLVRQLKQTGLFKFCIFSVLFNVINDGNPIGNKFFFDIFKRLYSDKTDEEINQLVSMLMSEVIIMLN